MEGGLIGLGLEKCGLEEEGALGSSPHPYEIQQSYWTNSNKTLPNPCIGEGFEVLAQGVDGV